MAATGRREYDKNAEYYAQLQQTPLAGKLTDAQIQQLQQYMFPAAGGGDKYSGIGYNKYAGFNQSPGSNWGTDDLFGDMGGLSKEQFRDAQRFLLDEKRKLPNPRKRGRLSPAEREAQAAADRFKALTPAQQDFVKKTVTPGSNLNSSSTSPTGTAFDPLQLLSRVGYVGHYAQNTDKLWEQPSAENYSALKKLYSEVGGLKGTNLAEARKQTGADGKTSYTPWTDQDLANWVLLNHGNIPTEIGDNLDRYQTALVSTYNLLKEDQAKRTEMFGADDLRSVVPLGTEDSRYNDLYGFDARSSMHEGDWRKLAMQTGLAAMTGNVLGEIAGAVGAATGVGEAATGAGAVGGSAPSTLGSVLAPVADGIETIYSITSPYQGAAGAIGAAAGGAGSLGSALTSRPIEQPMSGDVETVNVTTTPYNPGAGLDPGLLAGLGGVAITPSVPTPVLPEGPVVTPELENAAPAADDPNYLAKLEEWLKRLLPGTDQPKVELPSQNPTDQPKPKEETPGLGQVLEGILNPTTPPNSPIPSTGPPSSPAPQGTGTGTGEPGQTGDGGADSTKPETGTDWTRLLWGYLDEEVKNREQQQQKSLGAALNGGRPNYGPKVFGISNPSLAAQIQLAVQTNSRARGGPYGL